MRSPVARFVASGWIALGVVGCASTQRVSVRSVPAGAEVFLQRMGDIELRASVSGVDGRLDVEGFEEEYFSLGTSPVRYEFDLSERQAELRGGVVGGKMTRRYKEGRLLIVLDGYRPVERLVRFTGSPIELEVPLDSAPRSPGDEPGRAP